MIESSHIDDNGVRVVFTGLVTSKELFDTASHLYDHPGFGNWKYQLWIFHSVSDIVISVEEIRQLAERNKVESLRNPGEKIAIVSDSPLAFGLARVYEGFYGDGPWQTVVFYEIDKAEAWINTL